MLHPILSPLAPAKNMPPLLCHTTELALDLLEKNGVLYPFCRALSVTGEKIVVCKNPDNEASFQEAVDSIRLTLRNGLPDRRIAAFALCADIQARFQDEAIDRRFLKIEYQDGTVESAIYYFPLKVENGKAEIGSYTRGEVTDPLI